MPSSSNEQRKTMSAIAHGWKPKGSAAGIPKGVAEEFHEADKGHKYGAKGRAFGGVAPMISQAAQPTMNPAMMQGMNPANATNNNPATLNNAAPMQAMQQPMQPAMAQMPINGVAAPMQLAPVMGPDQPNNAAPPGPAGSRGFAYGGAATASIKSPIKTFKGPIVSKVPGRTDLHFGHVPSGSFVIPADIVSGHGQGNSLAGMDHLQKLFRMGPHANSQATNGKPSALQKLAKGGSADEHVGKPVPVKLAGGEIVVPPEHVLETMQRICGKKMTLAQAHDALDQWVISKRKKLRKTLAALPGPARD
jgi:hypothetical protein